MHLTKRAKELLTLMDETEDYLIQDGLDVWVGYQRTSAGMVIYLQRLCLIREDSMSPGIYFINGSGKRAIKGLPPYACEKGHYHETIWDVIACRGTDLAGGVEAVT